MRKPKAILLYGHISTLVNKKGYCWATNDYFAKQLKVDKRTVIDYVNLLVEKGYIKRKIFHKENSKEVEKRILSIFTTPSDTDFTRSGDSKFITPSDVDFTENNTSINNTSINKLSSYVLTFYENNIGMISPWLREDIEDEVKDWNEINNDEAERIIVEALKNAIGVQARNKWKYAKSILSSWKERNIKSLSDIEVSDKQHQREIQAKYSHPRYSNRPHIEEKVPNWDQKPQERTDSGQATSDIKNLMTRINQKIKNNKEDEENE